MENNEAKPSIFLSYSHAQKEYAIQIQEALQDIAIVNRDEKQSEIDGFMRSILSHDLVIFLISVEFLESEKCMYEASLALKGDEVGQIGEHTNLMFLVSEKASVLYDQRGRGKYINLWVDKFSEMSKLVKSTFNDADPNLSDGYRSLNKIHEKIGVFFNVVANKYWNLSFEDETDLIVKKVKERLDGLAGGKKEANGNNGKQLTNPNIIELDEDTVTITLRKCPYDNVFIAEERISFFSDKKSVKLVGELAASKDEPLCVIYTGGSAGMVREKDGDQKSALVQLGLSDFVKRKEMCFMKNLDVDLHFYSFDAPIDSANIIGTHWSDLADCIGVLHNYYQGFVIIHGANTLTYTSSALSFMLDNLSVPVVITGSEFPLDDHRADAIQNIQRSMYIAAHKTNRLICFQEVCVMYGDKLLKGNRATRQRATDTKESFDSPNAPQLGMYKNDVLYLQHEYARTKNDKNKFLKNGHFSTSKNIFIFDVFPEMDMGLFKQIQGYGNLNALIIRTFGVGGVPAEDEYSDFLTHLGELIDDGKIVVHLTQNPAGSKEVVLNIEDYTKLFDIGAINVTDMVTEAAFCKLKHLFKRNELPTDDEHYIADISSEMTINLKGEMSRSTYIANFTGANKINAQGEPRELTGVFGRPFDKNSIERVEIRITGIKITNNRKNSDFKFSVYCDGDNGNTQIECYETKNPSSSEFPANISLHAEELPNGFVDLLKSDHGVKLYMDSANHEFTFKKVSLLVFVKEDEQ